MGGAVAGTGVAVAGTVVAVAVAGALVAVAVAVGDAGTLVAVAAAFVAVAFAGEWAACVVALVAVAGTRVAVAGTGVAVAGTFVAVAAVARLVWAAAAVCADDTALLVCVVVAVDALDEVMGCRLITPLMAPNPNTVPKVMPFLSRSSRRSASSLSCCGGLRPVDAPGSAAGAGCGGVSFTVRSLLSSCLLTLTNTSQA